MQNIRLRPDIYMDKTVHKMHVAYANFNPNNRKANFNSNNPNNENDNLRGRASERVYLL